MSGYIHPMTVTNYYLYFNETGFPSGGTWEVTFDNVYKSSTTSSIEFTLTNAQTYSYSLNPQNYGGYQYIPSPSSGTASAALPAHTVDITYTGYKLYFVEFNETGLSGTEWYLNISGQTSLSGTGTSLSTNLINNSYTYTIASGMTGYSISPSSGSITVAGKSVYEAVTFTYTLAVSISSSKNPSDSGQSVTLTATASGGSSSYTNYNFFLNGTSVQSGSGSTYVTTTLPTGSPTVYVIVTDSNSHTAQSSALTQTVHPLPSVSISSNDNPSWANAQVTFTAVASSGSGSYTDYQFYLGGTLEQSGTSTTYSYTFSSAGSYSLYVVVTDSLGGTGTSSALTQTVNVVVGISSNINPSNVGVSITFTASGQGASSPDYAFYLSGSLVQNSTSATYAHAFTSTGSYTVSVTVYSSASPESASMTQTVDPLPSVSISASYTTVDTGVSVTYTATPSSGTGSYSAFYFYSNGVLMQDSGSTTWTTSFSSSGSYSIYVVVYDYGGGTGTSGTINEQVNPLPTVSISSSANPESTGVQFTLTAGISGGTSPYTYQWSLGGTVISGATSSTYVTSESSAGTYNFTVKITDTFSNSATSSSYTETITSTLTVTISSSKINSDIGQSITFTSSASGGTGTYSYFSFSINGVVEQNSTATAFVFTFSTSGSFNVSVYVHDSGSNHGSNHLTQTVYADPTVSVTASASAVDIGVSVTFYSHPSSGYGSYTYSWNQGLGSAKNVSGTFTAAGSYTITVTVTDGTGYQVSGSFSLTVNPLPTVSISSSANPSTAGSQVTFTATVTGGTAPFTYAFYIEIVSATLSQETFTYTITQSGSYWNSSFIYFNYTQPLSGINFPSSPHFRFSITNLTVVNPTAQVDNFVLSSQNFTECVLTKSGSHASIIGFMNSTTSADLKISTSEFSQGIISFNYAPSFGSAISGATSLSCTAISESGTVMNSLELSINGVDVNTISGTGTDSISMQYSLSTWFGNHPLGSITVVWYGISSMTSQSVTVNYGTTVFVTNKSQYVSVLFSNNITQKYPLTINNPLFWSESSITVGSNPSGIALSSTNAYVANGNGTVSVIGLSNNTVWKWITVGANPAQIVISSSNVYVTNNGGSSISVIGLINFTNWKTISVGAGVMGITLSSTNAYAISPNVNQVAIIGLSNQTDWKTITTTDQPFFISLSPTNAYITLVGNSAVYVMGLSNNTIWKTISTGSRPYEIVVGSSNVYVSMNTNPGSISIIGLTNDTVWKTVAVGPDPAGIALSQYDVYVANNGNTTVSVIGRINYTEWKTLTVGSNPLEVATSASDIYATNNGGSTVSVIIHPSLPIGTLYQQLITLSNSSQYGINKNATNFQISLPNGTQLYTWIQSYNSSSLQMWVKVPYGTAQIELEVYPSFENLLSSSGFLGYGRTYFNAPFVFTYATDFTNLTGWSASSSSLSVTLNKGLNLSSSAPRQTLRFSKVFYQPLMVLSYMQLENPNNFDALSDYATVWMVGSLNAVGFVGRIAGTTYSQSESIGNFNTYSMEIGPTGELLYNGVIIFSSSAIYSATNQFEYYIDNGSVANVSFFIIGSYIPSMPTISIGTGTIWQSNATLYNATYQHYGTFAPDSHILTNGQYTYTVPDSFDSKYITVIYNSSWSFDYASYNNYVLGSEAGQPFLTFLDVNGIGSIQFTLTEPIVIAQPLGTLSLGVLPSIAVNGLGFFEFPAGLLHWEANNIPVNPDGFSVVVGQPTNIQAYSGSGALIYNYTYTPTRQISFLQTYVNITQFQFNNLNSTDEVQISAVQNNVTQAESLLSPYGTGASSQTIYLPSGSYTFHYTQLNYSSGSAISSSTAPVTSYNGQYWVTLSGYTIFQIGNQLKSTNASIQKSLQSIQVIISVNDSEIKNLTLALNVSLKDVNSSTQSAIIKVLTNISFLQNTIGSLNVSDGTRFNVTDDIIKTFENNQVIVDTYLENTINTIKNLTDILKVNLAVANATIGELKFIASQNFTALNSTVKNDFASVFENQSFIRSMLQVFKDNFTSFAQFVNSTIGIDLNYVTAEVQNMNSSALLFYEQILNNVSKFGNMTGTEYLNLERNLSLVTGSVEPITYQLIPQNGTISGNSYYLPIVILDLKDQPLSTNGTIALLKNLTVKFESSGESLPIFFTAPSVSTHGFVLKLHISVAMLNEINNRTGFLLLESNSNGNNAAGIVSSMPYKVPQTFMGYIDTWWTYLQTPSGILTLSLFLAILGVVQTVYQSRSERYLLAGRKRR
jgi:hypothetical protein